MRPCAFLLGLVLALSAPAAAAAARDTVVALAPIVTLIEGGRGAAAVEGLLVFAIETVPDHRAIPPDKIRELLRRLKRRDLEACEGAAVCLAELGRLAGAQIVIYGEAGSLAGDRVVYLKAVDAATGAERGSTAVVLEKRVPAAAARSAAVRLLAPDHYTGVLELEVDVRGASVFVDGRGRGQSPLAPLDLPAGTHALRVTHPRYRDFVRFVEVAFDERKRVVAELLRYPVVGERFHAGAQGRSVLDSPWVVAGAGVAVAATVAVIVALWPRDLARDRDVTVHGP